MTKFIEHFIISMSTIIFLPCHPAIAAKLPLIIYRLSHATSDINDISRMRENSEEKSSSRRQHHFFLLLLQILADRRERLELYLDGTMLQNSNKMHASADSKILSPLSPSSCGKIAADGSPVREGPPPTQLQRIVCREIRSHICAGRFTS